MRIVVALLCAVAIFAAPPAAAAPPIAPPVERHVLSNGMRVVLAPDAGLDDVTVIVRYDVGSADDPSGKDGLAHLVEHLMFSGSKHAPAGAHARWIAQAGGWGMNGMTGFDHTSYFVTVPPEQLPLVLWLESDRMGFLADALEQATLDRERVLVADENHDSVIDRPFGRVGEIALEEVFPLWHPYHREHDPRWLKDLSLRDVRAFLRTWYGPANANLFVVGRFEPAATLAMVERYFGDLRGAPPPARPLVPASWPLRDVEVQMAAQGSRSQVLVAWATPAFLQPGDAELDVAALILADPRGRLQRELVGAGLAESVSAVQRSMTLASEFLVRVVAADKQPLAQIAGVVARVVSELARDVTADECARARAELAEARVLQLETSGGRASRLAGAPSLESPWQLDRYDHIQPQDVARVVRQMLVPSRRAVVLAHSNARVPVSGTIVERTERLP
jgi:zinc protease